MKTIRKAVSTRTRFEIFKRDNYVCIYCGATPVMGPLTIDHVVPVASGGTNDPANLVTACLNCNGGKSAVPLDKKKFASKTTDTDRDHSKQILEYLAVQREIGAAKSEVVSEVLAQWVSICGEAPAGFTGRLQNLLNEFGIHRLVEAFWIVARREIRNPTERVKYLNGVLKRFRAEDAPPRPPPTEIRRSPLLARCNEAVTGALRAIGADPSRFPTQEDKFAEIAKQFSLASGEWSQALVEMNASTLSLETGFNSLGVGLDLIAENGQVICRVAPDPSFNPYEEAWSRLNEAIGGFVLGSEIVLLHQERDAVSNWLQRFLQEEGWGRNHG